MNDMQRFMGGMLPTSGIPQLKNTSLIPRTFHMMKLADLSQISKLESEIATNNVGKLKATLEAMTLMATFGERIKAEMEMVELNQKHQRALVRQEEAKAKVIETEAKKEEFDFFQYMKSVKDED